SLVAGAAVAAFVPSTERLGGELRAAGVKDPAVKSNAVPAAEAPSPGEGDSKESEDGPGRNESLPAPSDAEIDYRRSKAVGDPWDGKLERGVLLPREGKAWFSWDPIERQDPNRQWRRWGTDKLIRMTVRVVRQWKQANPRAPRLPIGDLSRPRGGDFGPQFGSIGHGSHQNGLDIDIYYPRKDGKPKPPDQPSQVWIKPSQDLVDRFVAAGAEKVFVGPSLPLTGPNDVVVPLVHHDNHIHVRIPNPRR
ncbi:MAG: penicillin-insensitive murein endopeptidase, partial [Solirubrobacterales bacterium]